MWQIRIRLKDNRPRRKSLNVVSSFFSLLICIVLKLDDLIQIVSCGLLLDVLKDEILEPHLSHFEWVIWVVIGLAGVVESDNRILRGRTPEVSVTRGQVGLLCHPDFLQVLHALLVLSIREELPFSGSRLRVCWFSTLHQRRPRATRPRSRVSCSIFPHSSGFYASRTTTSSSSTSKASHCLTHCCLHTNPDFTCSYLTLKVAPINSKLFARLRTPTHPGSTLIIPNRAMTHPLFDSNPSFF